MTNDEWLAENWLLDRASFVLSHSTFAIFPVAKPVTPFLRYHSFIQNSFFDPHRNFSYVPVFLDVE
jgi:hypothetical protein